MDMPSEIKRIAPNLAKDIEALQAELSKKQLRQVSFTEASARYAETAFTPSSDVTDALKKMGRYRL